MDNLWSLCITLTLDACTSMKKTRELKFWNFAVMKPPKIGRYPLFFYLQLVHLSTPVLSVGVGWVSAEGEVSTVSPDRVPQLYQGDPLDINQNYYAVM